MESTYLTVLTPASAVLFIYPILLLSELVMLVWFVMPWPVSEQPWRRLFASRFSFAWAATWLAEIVWLLAFENGLLWLAMIAAFAAVVALVAAWYVSVDLTDGATVSSSRSVDTGREDTNSTSLSDAADVAVP
jgi:hypothetical protein